MIFVTVGTHEQQFDRLIKKIDELKGNHVIDEDVIIQTGFSTYTPKYCTWQKLYPYHVMEKHIRDARLVITHGGPSSFIMPLQMGKIPIVVPRQRRFQEHINDHQIEFCNTVLKRHGNIMVIEDINNIQDIILKYDNLIQNMGMQKKSNNYKFNYDFQKIVLDLFHI